MIIKCKMCGAPCTITDENQKVFTCEYCNSQQTLVSLDDEKKVNLNERANQYRRNGEFDKALDLFEKVLAFDDKDPDVYWNIVLCKYGVTYVKDPSTGRQVPTVNRTQNISVLSDPNYKKALDFSDSIQDGILEQQAKEIDKINKGILAISDKEEPYDVFISYKETEINSNRRSKDSILANQIYDQLRREGFKVFFSRISLKEKAGKEFEPVIYSALKTAKVMIIVSTSKENMNSPWVKNEWSRFLHMAENDKSKIIIPVYKGMDPYEDFPDELALYQGLDLSDLSTIPELILTVRKKLEVEKKSTKKIVEDTTSGGFGSPTTKSLLRRVELFLLDEDFASAGTYCEKALDIDPESFDAYILKATVDFKVDKKEKLGNIGYDEILENKNVKKALLFANDSQKSWFDDILSESKKAADEAKKQKFLDECGAQLHFQRSRRRSKYLGDADELTRRSRKISSEITSLQIAMKDNNENKSSGFVSSVISVILSGLIIACIVGIILIVNLADDYTIQPLFALLMSLLIISWIVQFFLNLTITSIIEKFQNFFCWILGPLSIFIPIARFKMKDSFTINTEEYTQKILSLNKEKDNIKAELTALYEKINNYETDNSWIDDSVIDKCYADAVAFLGYDSEVKDQFKATINK